MPPFPLLSLFPDKISPSLCVGIFSDHFLKFLFSIFAVKYNKQSFWTPIYIIC